MAEGLFRRLLGNRKDIEVASAGVHAVRGQPPSLYAVEVCAEAGVDISNLRSQPLTASAGRSSDTHFCHDRRASGDDPPLFPQGAEKTFLLREFEEPGTTVWRDLPDPIGLGREVYEECARHHQKRFTERARLRRTKRTGAGRCDARTRSYRLIQWDHLPHHHRIRIDRFDSLSPVRRRPAQESIRKFSMPFMAEEKRQRENIELIASENFTSRAVMEAQGSCPD